MGMCFDLIGFWLCLKASLLSNRKLQKQTIKEGIGGCFFWNCEDQVIEDALARSGTSLFKQFKQYEFEFGNP